MGDSSVTIWSKNEDTLIPKKIKVISDLVVFGQQLSVKDRRQIINGFENENFEMVANFISSKAISSLKNQLSKMGVHFIAELLDRPDIDEYSNLQQAISEYEAVKLAEELALIHGAAAFRLKKALETVAYFNQPELEDIPENELTEEETKTIIRSCIEGGLRYDNIEIPIDFKNFRHDLENTTISDGNVHIIKLLQSPYFFQRTTLRILLSIIKTATGAQLENSLANANLIIPKIWTNLKHPEKYQVGRSYSELFTDGKSKSASGIKYVLLKVKGFDFVPEDLRSTSFIKVANKIIRAHEGMNNFYNEPGPINTLLNMGSVIPIPAFPICMTAILSVKLGNSYGVSKGAQKSVDIMLNSITNERWTYFFNKCLQSNERVLYKLLNVNPLIVWVSLFSPEIIDRLLPTINERDVVNLLKFTKNTDEVKINSLVRQMITKIGYSAI